MIRPRNGAYSHRGGIQNGDQGFDQPKPDTALTGLAGMALSTDPIAPQPSHQTRNRVVVLTIVLIVATLIALYTVPIQASYSAGGISKGCYVDSFPSCPTVNFPMGAHVTGTFSTVGGSPVGLRIVGGNGLVFNSTASSGSFSFKASNPPYAFGPAVDGDGSTSVSGEYSTPLLMF